MNILVIKNIAVTEIKETLKNLTMLHWFIRKEVFSFLIQCFGYILILPLKYILFSQKNMKADFWVKTQVFMAAAGLWTLLVQGETIPIQTSG